MKFFGIKPKEARDSKGGELYNELLDELVKELKPIYPHIIEFLRRAMFHDITYDIGLYYNGAKIPVGIFIVNNMKSKLNLFFIHPEYRNFNYGREMFNAASQEFPYQRFNFTVPKLDTNIEEFYLKMGCKKEGGPFKSEDCNYEQQKYTFGDE